MKLTLSKSLFILITLLLSHNVVNAENKHAHKVDAINTTINGVYIGSGEQEILKSLGSPTKTTLGFSEAITKSTKNFYFDGLSAYISENSILNLTCTKNCITDKDIKIGSSRKEVFDAYGKNLEQKNKAMYIFFTPNGYIDAYLVFHFENSVVIKIEFWVDYI